MCIRDSICGDRTHAISDCPQAGKPRSEWFVTKAINKIQHSQREEEDDDDDSDENEERGRSRSATPRRSSRSRSSRGRRREGRETVDQDWCTYQCIKGDDRNDDRNEKPQKRVSFEQSNTTTHRIETKLLLDTGSTIRATIMNQDLITNIRVSDKPTVMQTNAGSKLLNLDGDLKGFGITKYDPSHMANIMGFSHMADKYHVIYDNEKEDAFVIRDRSTGNIAVSYTHLRAHETLRYLVCRLLLEKKK